MFLGTVLKGQNSVSLRITVSHRHHWYFKYQGEQSQHYFSQHYLHPQNSLFGSGLCQPGAKHISFAPYWLHHYENPHKGHLPNMNEYYTAFCLGGS